jgi:hypothetical protein
MKGMPGMRVAGRGETLQLVFSGRTFSSKVGVALSTVAISVKESIPKTMCPESRFDLPDVKENYLH